MRRSLLILAAAGVVGISGQAFAQTDGVRPVRSVEETLKDGPAAEIDYSRRQGVHLDGDLRGRIADQDGIVDGDIDGDGRPNDRVERFDGANRDGRDRTIDRSRDQQLQPEFVGGSADNRWRYKWHNDQWWYYMPNKEWMIHRDGAWVRYNAATYTSPRRSTGYRGVDNNRYDNSYDNRGYNQPYNNQPYNNRQYDNRYYDNNYNRGVYNDSRRGYNDGRNYNAGRYYNDGRNNGRYRGGYDQGAREGAAIGGIIGSAIGGRDGGRVGAGIGAAIGSDR